MKADIIPLGTNDMRDAAEVRRIALWHRLPWLPILHTADEDEAYWRTVLLAEGQIRGARVEQRLAGVIAYGDGWIHQLYILPEYQGKGLGTRLMACAMRDMDDISLWTFERNSGARAFYEGHGFVAVEQTDGSGNEEREPDILYRWRRAAALLNPSTS